MSDQNIDVSLIQRQGRQIIHKLRQELDKSDSLLMGEDERNKILKRAQTLVDADRSGLRVVEKGILLQYVRDGINGQVDPDARLSQIAAVAAKVNDSNLAKTSEPRGQLRSQARGAGTILALVLMLGAFALSMYKEDSRKTLHHFATPSVSVKQSDDIDYNQRLEQKWYFVRLPKNYDAKKPAGLIVYISSGNDVRQTPGGWSDVLDARNIIFVAPQDAGNDIPQQSARLGLGVLGALAAIKEYSVNPTRVYASGISGGARTAGGLGFLQPDLFTGTIQSCGADYYRAVPHIKGEKWIDTSGNQYGNIEVTPDGVRKAKANVKFVFATGPRDFRHGNLLDIYDGGFRPDGFKCKFIDDPKAGHEDCSAQSLEQALTYLDGK